MVFRKFKTVVFVHGCFWHGHQQCKYFVQPKSNAQFWLNKIEANRNRDDAVEKAIRELGWHVLIVWECDIRKNPKRTAEDLAFRIRNQI